MASLWLAFKDDSTKLTKSWGCGWRVSIGIFNQIFLLLLCIIRALVVDEVDCVKKWYGVYLIKCFSNADDKLFSLILSRVNKFRTPLC